MSQKALGKTMEEIMEDKRQEFIAAAPFKKDPQEEIARLKQELAWVERDREAQCVFLSDRLERFAEENKELKKEEQKRALGAHKGRVSICSALAAIWTLVNAAAFFSITFTPDIMRTWLTVCTCLGVSITSAWLYTVVYTHETFEETRAKIEEEQND